MYYYMCCKGNAVESIIFYVIMFYSYNVYIPIL